MLSSAQKKKAILYITLGVAVISLIIPIVIWVRDFYTGIHDRIDSGKLSDFATFQTLIISFWGLLANLVLVIIAYKAFRNFGVKEQFHNKQLTLVTELATDISSTILSNMLYETKKDFQGNDRLITAGYTLSFFEISLGFDYKKFDTMYVRTNNIENTFPFLKYRNNPVLPPIIAKQLNKLYRPLQYSFAVQKDSLPKNYVVLHSKNVANDDYSKDWVYEFYVTPTDFTNDCHELKESIIKWFKEYGADDINI